MLRSLFHSMLCVAMALVAFGAAAEDVRRPNVVLILMDDLGYNDIGVYGAKDLRTPNIDSIAKNGVRFTDGYVTCPVCSPSRAGLITGRYQQRFGHEFNPTNATRQDPDFGLPVSEKTLADSLKNAGYKTGLVGKWHLGFAPEYWPTRRGFDEFFGLLGGKHKMIFDGSPQLLMRGENAIQEREYLTDALKREALAFVDRHKAGPFFLYLPFNAQHIPLEATPKYLARFPEIQDERRRTFAAMLSAVDDAVGALLEKLRESNLEENTLVFFVSDNGGNYEENASLNTPLSGTKNFCREGGIRVPFMVQWKGKLPAGKAYSEMVSTLDVVPTVLAATGARSANAAKLDGVDLLPCLKGDVTTPPHDRLFWRFGDQFAVRQGHWKLLRQGTDKPQLFDLSKDVAESNDQGAANPQVLKELDGALAKWTVGLKPPLWPAPPVAKKPRRG